MRKEKKLFLYLVLIFVCSFLSACGGRVESEPDVLSSFSTNRDENLLIVANRNKIDDKEEFARQLVLMCKDNSFKSIKFSTDRGYATSLDIGVYLWKDQVEGNTPVMTVSYKPKEWNSEYDIVNNPDEYILCVDGEEVKNP